MSSFPSSYQEHLYLVVDFKEYPGNYEAELLAFLTGQPDDVEFEELRELAQPFAEDLACPFDPEDLFKMQLDAVGHFKNVGLIATPGLWNNGHGQIYPDDHPLARKVEEKYPAYLGVGFPLQREPTREEWAYLRARILDFPAAYVLRARFAGELPEIRNIRILKTKLFTESTTLHPPYPCAVPDCKEGVGLEARWLCDTHAKEAWEWFQTAAGCHMNELPDVEHWVRVGRKKTR
jgi:hypothetical protein